MRRGYLTRIGVEQTTKNWEPAPETGFGFRNSSEDTSQASRSNFPSSTASL